VNSTNSLAAKAMRPTRANTNSDMKAYNNTDEFYSAPLRNTKGRSLQTLPQFYGRQPTSATNDPLVDPRKRFHSTSMYTGPGLQLDESIKLRQFYGTTTTGVCIDEKVLTQIR